MGKKNKQARRGEEKDQEAVEPISAQGWKIIAGGIAALVAGFVVLTRADSLGRNWASVVSPLLILGGYGIVALGIFWDESSAVSASTSSSVPPQTD